jgi:nitroimidazol reductase NimA-like FMN-containing flavoprotein (pyridoxamine 5'-phosphate oxidase superfamily)
MEIGMRRADKEITDRRLISQIIEQCQVCRLGLAKGDTPYLLPVSFGYDGQAVYFHTAREGRKIEFLTANPTVCFEFEHDVRLVTHDSSPCKWTFSFQSVIGYGTVLELTDADERVAGLAQIVKHYSGREWAMGGENLEAIRVWKISIESLTGKQSKDKVVS